MGPFFREHSFLDKYNVFTILEFILEFILESFVQILMKNHSNSVLFLENIDFSTNIDVKYTDSQRNSNRIESFKVKIGRDSSILLPGNVDSSFLREKITQTEETLPFSDRRYSPRYRISSLKR